VPCSVPDSAGGRSPVHHRTRDRPQQVRRAIHSPVLIGTGHRPASVPCSVPDSAAADNPAGNQRYRRRATTRINQSQTIMTITQRARPGL